MSKIRLHGSSSGYTEIAPVAASGNNTLTLPNDGTIISKDSNGAVGVTSITVGTGVTAGDGRVTATSFHGSAASLTAIPAANIVGVATAGFERTGGFAGGITELDCYRISSIFQGSAYHITSNWERFDASGEGKKGTGVSESGGYFTFPSTGYWYIIFNATFYRGANSTFYGQFSHIRTTTDNSTYSERARGASGMYSEGGNSRTGATVSTIFKCENTSTHKVIFGVETETSTYTYGSTANNQTHAIFIKLADI